MDENDEIIGEFLVESHENLDQMDHDLVELEQAPDSKDLLSSVFRAIHTIKGTSGFLALSRLEKVTHVGENLLAQLRDGHRHYDEPTAEVLLRMVDVVRELLAVIEATGSDESDDVDISPVVAAIEAVLDGSADAAQALAASASSNEAVAPAPPVAVEAAPAEAVAVVETHAPPAEAPTDVPAPVEAGPVESVPVESVPVESVPVETVPVQTPLADAPPVDPPPAKASGKAEDDHGKSSVMDASVRVDVDLLDSLVQQVGELVLTRNQILQKAETLEDAELVRALQRLDLVASELQEGVMKTRMQPIGQVWSKMPRTVRDLARQLGRKVDLVMEGHETELDRTLLEALKGPLTHLVRNSLDHGIEPPQTRLAAGKPETGKLLLRAFHESGQVVVEITDDGKGMDPDRIAEIALSRGVITGEQLRRMETREILELIFQAGFSTADQVTNVSGRGVGMDVVRTNIEGIGGSVDLTSVKGHGTTVRVRIPLTLAIIPALLVGEAAERYAIPQASLVELVRLDGPFSPDLEYLAGAQVLRLRGKLLPLVRLRTVLGMEPVVDDGPITIVVLQADNLRIGLIVEEVHDTQEIVVKPVGRQLKELTMFAGATILGDGRVALILDVAGIAADQGIDPSSLVLEDKVSASAEQTTSLLVLEVGGRRAALPLADVARLEEFDASAVERSGNLEVVQYRGSIMPLVRLSSAIGLTDQSAGAESLSVVVHGDGASAVGMVVESVLDVVETTVVANQAGKRHGVLGSAIVQDRVTDLVDLETVVSMGAMR